MSKFALKTHHVSYCIFTKMVMIGIVDGRVVFFHQV